MAKKNSVAHPAPVLLAVPAGTDRKAILRQRGGRIEVSADQKVQPFPAPTWTPPAVLKHSQRPLPRIKAAPTPGTFLIAEPNPARENRDYHGRGRGPERSWKAHRLTRWKTRD